ncbi:MAG TPA: ABC transporter ATP-binding protein [Gaiellaceae bacterium]|nr:ABC transporter ATP-binding protein [Gaiellaceae bacterium]
MSAAPAIETIGLAKTYHGTVPALVDLDLTVARGEVFGYLGPNGAGKSTTIRLLLGLIRPTAGRATIFGRDVHTEGVAARREAGYLPGDLRLSDRLTGREQLESLARLRGRVDRALRTSLCERLQVDLDRPIRQLSKGNRQKIGVVQAFMHRPELVVLDEPTAGLDPLLQTEVRALLRETAAEGRSVFISSHSLDEVQHVADRVGIIRRGRLVDVDAVDNLRERSLRHVTVTFPSPPDPAAFAGIDGVRVVEATGSALKLSSPESAMSALVKRIAEHDIVDLVSQPADLEEIFLELYREGDDGS